MKSITTHNRQLNRRRIIINECDMANDDFRRLYRIFRLTICPGMSEKAFEAYYQAADLDYIDVTFFYATGGEISGFSAAAFYKRIVSGRPVTIARSAIGLLPQYRGGTFSKQSIYKKYMQYKLRHPGRKLILTIFASNPFVYGMVCKYTGTVYPRYNQPIPTWVLALKKGILESSKLQRRERQPFVIRINFEVIKSSEVRQQAMESANPHIRYFVQQTGLQPCMSLLLIIPVSFRNILLCIWLMLWYFCAGKATTFRKSLGRYTTICKNRLTCWLNQSEPAGYAKRKPV